MYAMEPKNKWTSLFLCFFFGVFGIHKFYEGRVFWGLIYFFTGGIFFFGVIIDFFVLLLFTPNPYFIEESY